MKRDFDLIRKILLAIEEQYVCSNLMDLEVEGYDLKTVAYHCKLLFDAGLVDDYERFDADDELQNFQVGSLTWEGHEFLDEIRDSSRWNKTKEVMHDKGIPLFFDAIKTVSSTLISSLAEGAVKGILK